jgi:hypothetical protein
MQVLISTTEAITDTPSISNGDQVSHVARRRGMSSKRFRI